MQILIKKSIKGYANEIGDIIDVPDSVAALAINAGRAIATDIEKVEEKIEKEKVKVQQIKNVR